MTWHLVRIQYFVIEWCGNGRKDKGEIYRFNEHEVHTSNYNLQILFRSL